MIFIFNEKYFYFILLLYVQYKSTRERFFKVGLSTSKKNSFICFNLKIIKIVFYLFLKALFVLEIFKLLSLLFGQVEKRLN